MTLFGYSFWTCLAIPFQKGKMACLATSQCTPFYNKYTIKIFMPMTLEFFTVTVVLLS